MRTLRLRWAGTCASCSSDLPASTEVLWDSDAKTATCKSCTDPAPAPPVVIDRGVPGASAQRQYDRKSAKERRAKEAEIAQDAEWRAQIIEQRPVLGRIASAMTPKPTIGPERQSTAAWAKGAEGERRVGGLLDTVDGVQMLHDRRIPGSKANIDHIAVAPTGVYAVDAKQYEGQIEVRDVGSWLRPDRRLYVKGRDRTKLLAGVRRQVDVIRGALDEADLRVPVAGVLCFTGAIWPRFFPKPIDFDDVTVIWPQKLGEMLVDHQELAAEQRDRIVEVLASVLQPA